MVMAAYLTLPGRLADAAVALGTTEKKMEEGKDLIRYFSVPCKPTKTNGGRTRNLPTDAPEKWAVYRQYNAQDVETERAIRKALEKYPLPEQEWELYALDQQINDRGVRVDKKLVKNAIAVDAVFAQAAYQRAKELTGLENPGSVNQLGGSGYAHGEPRQEDRAGKGGADGWYCSGTVVAIWPQGHDKGRVRDIVARKAGFSSTAQMRRAQELADARPDLVEAVDKGEKTIGGAYQQMCKEEQGAKAVSGDPDSVSPADADKTDDFICEERVDVPFYETHLRYCQDPVHEGKHHRSTTGAGYCGKNRSPC